MFTAEQKRDITRKVYAYRERLIANGFDVFDITDVKFGTKKRAFGTCQKNSYRRNATITIHENALYGELDETILHELCHAMPNTKGHDAQFHAYAGRVNRIFGTNIKTRASKEETARAREHIPYKYIIRCKHCGAEQGQFRKTDAIRFVLGEPHKCIYTCKCGNRNFEVLTNY